MCKLQSPSKDSPFDAVHLLGRFFHCSKQFLNSLILIPFCASAIFCFTFSTSAKCFPLRTFFIQGKKNKSLGVRLHKWGWGGGMGVMLLFDQKLLNTQCSVGRCVCKSPTMKWENALKQSSKKFTEAEFSLSQQRQLVH